MMVHIFYFSISVDVEKSLLERLGKSFRTPIKSTGKVKSPEPNPATSFPEGLGNRFRTPIKSTRKVESPEASPAITIPDSSPEFQPLFKTPKPLKSKFNFFMCEDLFGSIVWACDTFEK